MELWGWSLVGWSGKIIAGKEKGERTPGKWMPCVQKLNSPHFERKPHEISLFPLCYCEKVQKHGAPVLGGKPTPEHHGPLRFFDLVSHLC